MERYSSVNRPSSKGPSIGRSPSGRLSIDRSFSKKRQHNNRTAGVSLPTKIQDRRRFQLESNLVIRKMRCIESIKAIPSYTPIDDVIITSIKIIDSHLFGGVCEKNLGVRIKYDPQVNGIIFREDTFRYSFDVVKKYTSERIYEEICSCYADVLMTVWPPKDKDLVHIPKFRVCIIEKLSGIRLKPSIPKMVGFIYADNSCYMDSILMVMIASDTGFMKRIIEPIEGGRPKGAPIEGGRPSNDLNPVDVCEGKRGVENIGENLPKSKLLSKVVTLRRMVISDYRRLVLNQTIDICNNYRGVISECILDIGTQNRWATYEAYRMYGFFCKIFGLQYRLPRAYNNRTEDGIDHPIEGNDNVNYDMVVQTELTEYITDYDPSPRDQIVRWDLINSEWIVLYEVPGFTRIQNPWVVTSETVGAVIKAGNKKIDERRTLKKIRYIDETIIDDRYELTGVIYLVGARVKEGEVDYKSIREGHGHYTASLKIGGKWYRYNDMRPLLEPITFDEVKSSIGTPVMFFFKRNRLSEMRNIITYKGSDFNLDYIPKSNTLEIYPLTPESLRKIPPGGTLVKSKGIADRYVYTGITLQRMEDILRDLSR